MTLQSRLMIKLSFVYLLIGAALGTLMLLSKAFVLHPLIWALFSIHIEVMIFGWIIQFTLGMAHWILPRYLEGEARGNPVFANLMVISINAGIWLMIGAELNLLPETFRIVARMLELFTVILFIQLHWNRIATYKHLG